jgi:hypothetical protein
VFTVAAILRRDLDLNDLLNGFTSFCGFGDQTGTPPFSPGAHGTCEDRAKAFTVGALGAANSHQELLAGPASARAAMVRICRL